MRGRRVLTTTLAAMSVGATGCVGSRPAPRPDVPDVDACTLVSVQDVAKATGVDVVDPGTHVSSPLSGINQRSCEWGGPGPTGGMVAVSLQSPGDYDARSDLRDGVLSDGTVVKTDTYQVDTRGSGHTPRTAIGVWYREPTSRHVVRCEVDKSGAATYDVDAAAALAVTVARALT